MEPITLVVFRKWKEDDTVFALFPELPADIYGNHCDSYAHVGQHSGADYHACIGHSRPCPELEYRPLLYELTRVGYRLRVIQNATQHHHDKRREAAREYRKP